MSSLFFRFPFAGVPTQGPIAGVSKLRRIACSAVIASCVSSSRVSSYILSMTVVLVVSFIISARLWRYQSSRFLDGNA